MNKININNKRVKFEYHLEEIFEAGMVLKGSEIKVLRQNKGSIKEAYCTFVGDELFIRNMHIPEYDKASFNKPDPKRDRKLLLNRFELNKLFKKVKTKGFTIVPVKLYLSDKGKVKLQIALASGKKLHDKREDLKAKDAKREMDRLKKSF